MHSALILILYSLTLRNYINRTLYGKKLNCPDSQSTVNMRILRGIVRRIDRLGEKMVDENNIEWEKCIFYIELIGFSKRTPHEKLPENLVGKIVKVYRWCTFDWHYRTNVYATLTAEETERVLKGELDLTTR
ncbi:MAG: hypothetical protein DRJ49_01115 [Thermoprotei archaeon]|nr:MAG: hypothetical protein DRJ49_01115 [Thermoprotei archaeon]